MPATFEVAGWAQPDGPEPLAEHPGSTADNESHEDLSATSILERIRIHHPLRSASRRLPRYRPVRELSHGTMAIVQEVFDEDLQRRLAMKLLALPHDLSGDGLLRQDRKCVSRFLHEAQVISQLDHPGIVPIYDVGIDEKGRLYYTMPLIRGHDLRAIIELVHAGDPEWSTTRALGVMLKVCEAMAFAHARGVVHRDLKPANVMVGRFGQVYVLDWGLSCSTGRMAASPDPVPASHESTSMILARTAKELLGPRDHADSTCHGDVVGSPPYMAPEQVRGQHELVGPRSDVYALGAMLYHLLSGCIPYADEGSGVSPGLVLARSTRGAPCAVEKLAPEIAPELAAICNKAMSRQRLERYADMQELGRDLQAYLDDRVVRAYRTGALVELNKWCLRNKFVAITATVALVLMVATLALALASHGGDWGRLVSGGPPPEPTAGQLAGWEWDPATDVVRWGTGKADWWGSTTGAPAPPGRLGDLLGRVGEPDRGRLQAALRASLASGAPFALTHELRAPDGAARQVQTRGTVLLDAAGRPCRVVAICAALD